MNNELEKIDIIRERTGATYQQANLALESAAGDVVQALINLEEGTENNRESKTSGRKNLFGHELVNNIKEILCRGRNAKIRIKQGERTVCEIPTAVGAVGLLAALASSELALLGVLGSVAAMSKQYTFEFDQAYKSSQDKEEIETNN